MQILFFSHYYPPEVNAPASRTSEHARIWVQKGHRVTVVTCAPNHPAGKVYPGYRNALWSREQIDGVEVIRIWTWLAANEGFAPRIANYFSYMISALIAACFVARPDVIISTSPQFFCGLTGWGAKLLRAAPWVLEVRDLWPDSIVTVGAMKRGRMIRFLEWLEARAYRKADQVVSVTDGFVPHIAARRGRDDIAVHKNGVDLTLFRNGGGGEGVKARFGLEERTVAAYVGTHGMAHGLDTVLEAADLLRDDPRVGFLLVGDGSERIALAAKASQMGLVNLHIAGQMPKSEMPNIWSATDISIILLRKSETFKTVLPSKMFEAMAMECPIILGVEGEAATLLKSAGAGIAVEPQDARALAEAVRALVDDRERARTLGAQGGRFVTANFDRSQIADAYLRTLEVLVQ